MTRKPNAAAATIGANEETAAAAILAGLAKFRQMVADGQLPRELDADCATLVLVEIKAAGLGFRKVR
jgi:hypothetical protein